MDEKQLDQLLKMTIPSDGLWLPAGASTGVDGVDSTYWLIYYASVIAFFMIVVPLVIFMWRYRRRTKDQKAESQNDHSMFLEIAWTAIPTIFFALIFLSGVRGFTDANVAPDNAINIRVHGQKWFWQLTYTEDSNGNRLKDPVVVGKGAGQEFLIPLGVPVKLTITSRDVLHSFFVPNFRVKIDAVPGRYTTLWFEATQEGTFPILCTEYCGTNHSRMLAKFKVVSPKEFDKAIKGASGPSKASPKVGKKIYTQTCSACHSLDGNKGVGPSFKGLFGREEEMSDGTKVKVDANYILESINEPNKKIVKGFAPAMPPLGASLSDIEKDSIIMFIETVK